MVRPITTKLHTCSDEVQEDRQPTLVAEGFVFRSKGQTDINCEKENGVLRDLGREREILRRDKSVRIGCAGSLCNRNAVSV